MSAPLPNSPVCLFDGVCNLCNGSVRFILAHEAAASIRFAAVQSSAGRHLLDQLGLPEMPDTFVFIEDGRAFYRSQAALRIARHFRAPWRWLYLLRVVPRPVADRLYDLVARNRYRWFGKRDLCLIPSPAHAGRFSP